ncbi:hypothetical protein A9Q81_21780 [Gammaproteobacteria bacterium 42_54_T18]|nr:hypothetical protein A9Q81_21780 [Gammaproteobacteria bacterium 42_54_T18]
MSVLVFQIVIKQWDKGQSSPEHVAARAAIPARYAVATKPAYYVLDKPCIVDQHGDDISTNVFKNGRIKYGMLPDGRIRFDRFQVCGKEGGDILEYVSEDKGCQIVGPLNQGWVQCQYSWRYSVEEAGMRYWMYEEVTLNAVCMDEFDDECFLKTEPTITHNNT